MNLNVTKYLLSLCTLTVLFAATIPASAQVVVETGHPHHHHHRHHHHHPDHH